jgi:Mn2+/Fe2+ NRAMP family transporter
MSKLLDIALGIMVALGGFIDIGDLVFATGAGARFGYQLLWALLIGVIGIMVYSEMCGRVTTVSKMAVFDIIRQHFNPKLGWFAMSSSLAMNLLTCAAEIGGVALCLQLLTNFPYTLLIIIAVIALILIIWLLPFQGIERLFGFMGLGLLTLTVAALKLHPSWGAAAHGLVPHMISYGSHWSYLYFAVGIMAATLMPYEVYFYSAGAIEEKWKPKSDMSVNRMNTFIGYTLGGLAVAGIIIMSAELLRPHGITPEFLGTPILGGLVTLGKLGAVLALLGALFTIGGAAVESSLSGAYSISQFLGWKWGKHEEPLKVPRFTFSWLAILVIGAGIILSGIDPISLTEYAVIFSVVLMPLTYWPIFRMAQSRKVMGQYANKWFANGMGWLFFIVVCIVSVAAVPLMILSNRGQL